MSKRIHITSGDFQVESVQPERPGSDKARAVTTSLGGPRVTVSQPWPRVSQVLLCRAGRVFNNPLCSQSGVESYRSPMQRSPPARHRPRHMSSRCLPELAFLPPCPSAPAGTPSSTGKEEHTHLSHAPPLSSHP